MGNLKKEILHVLHTGKKSESILNVLSSGQENLLKNYSNPVFSNEDKNKILKKYIDLRDFDNSFTRYNKLQSNNYLDEAETEKEEIEQKVLKGYISNTKYIWHSENGDNTCNACKSLDGLMYMMRYSNVPIRIAAAG